MAQENAPTIESNDLTLADVFKDFYVVPSYQREFVWTEQQVEQLLRDIHDEFSEDAQEPPEYFIGSIVVSPGADGLLDLIDGQQRMTTAFVFLCAFRDYLKAHQQSMDALQNQIASTSINMTGDEVAHYRVELQYDDSQGILEAMAKNGAGIEQSHSITRSVANIIAAYDTVSTFIRTEFGDDVRRARRFYAYVVNRVKLIRIKTHSVAHALKVFETINDRGVGLDAMDLLKNLMFMQANKEDFDKLKDNWKVLVDGLYGAGEKPLRFLRYFIFASYDVDRLREDQIYGWFSKNEALCGYGADPIGFVEELVEAADAYTNFVAGNNVDGTLNRYLSNIRYLSGAARQHLILLLAGRKLDKENFTELCRQLEDLFFAYIITREPTKQFERSFARWAPQLREVHKSVQLEAFIATNFTPAKQNLSTRFDLAFQELTESSIQKYRMRYVLGKLAQYVNEQAYGMTEMDLGKFVNQRDVEHILPQTPTAEIVNAFDKPEEIQEYIRRLGNMTLLENSIDSSIGNAPFARKKAAYTKSLFLLTRTIAEPVTVGVKTKIDRAVASLLTFDEWTSESIEKRQAMLAKLARKVWNMPRED